MTCFKTLSQHLPGWTEVKSWRVPFRIADSWSGLFELGSLWMLHMLLLCHSILWEFLLFQSILLCCNNLCCVVLIMNCVKMFYTEKVSTLDTVKAGIVIVWGEKIGGANLVVGSERGRGEIKAVLRVTLLCKIIQTMYVELPEYLAFSMMHKTKFCVVMWQHPFNDLLFLKGKLVEITALHKVSMRCVRDSISNMYVIMLLSRQMYVLCYVCNKTNLMHYLSSVYWVTITLHVSDLLVAHHQEVAMYVYDNWYVLYVLVACNLLMMGY
jgi:hypothetical protein